MERPQIFDVEQILNEFIQEQRGQLVINLIPKDNKAPNADYYFEESNIIAELKCFQKDLFSNEEDFERVITFFQKWISNGLIVEKNIRKILFHAMPLPEECTRDLINACEKTIDRAIHHADKQIRETKLLLNQPNAKGLVLLANDGNYFLENKDFIGLIANLMQRKYLKSDIDGFVFFTINQVSERQDSDLDWNLWAPFYREENNIELGNFVNELGHNLYTNFLTRVTGIDLTEHIKTDNLEKGIDLIKDLKHIPKENIYKTKKKR